MHTLSTLFPAAFPALALSHFVALLSPGPDFFLLVGYAVRYRIRGSIGLCLGIAAGNALYIVLAIVGWGLLRQAPLLFLLIELLGAGYLLWIGSLLIRSRPATLAMESVRAARPGFGRQLLLGLGSSLLNPKNALFYLALMTSLLGPAVTLLQQTVSGLWMVSVVFFWDLLLVSAIALPQIQRRLGAIVWRVERAAGAILCSSAWGLSGDFCTTSPSGYMLKHMEKLAELKRAKLLALSLLLIAAALFITTLALPPSPWVGALKAISEAAMVGALADWFAVVALFRRIPLPFVARHTAIIPRNKDRIADNLGRFVEEKFLDTPSLVALIRRYQPALMLGNWFSQPENARRVGQHLLQVMSGFLELTDDARIQRLLRRAVHKAIDKVDLTQTSAMMLEGLTRDNRHQKLLDSLINQLIALLQRDSSRAFIARGIVHWLETEHPLKAKLLPTEWLGEHSAEMVTDAVNTLLDEVTHDRTHQIRQTFDRAVQKLIDNLKSDPDMAQKADNIKAWLKNDETFNHYLGEVWGDLRGWVKNDISSDDSRIKQRIAEAGQWFGETLLRDDALRESLNEHLEQAAHRVAPEFAAFLTRHISDTVKSWDARDMSRQIELNIGKDLQFIRINGTLVGGTIGLLLWLLSQIPSLLHLHIG
ncbi:inner membrane protein [Klebsiella pneumoniae]|nr:inner membrane protein [Klebsiella pneumoniae]